MKYYLFLIVAIIHYIGNSQEFKLSSPNKEIEITLQTGDKLSFSIKSQGEKIIKHAEIGINISKKSIRYNPKSTKTKYISNKIEPVVSLQNAIIENNYNELRVNFNKGIALELRAYNEGFSYRFLLSKKDSIDVIDEKLTLEFENPTWVSWANAESFKNDYQVVYQSDSIVNIDEGKMSTLPLLFKESEYKILFSEANLYDYPAMFLKKESQKLVANFPKVPLEHEPDGDRSEKILKEANYIATISGDRTLPWRFMVISKDDKDIAANEMVTKLSEQPENKKQFSWVKPGQVTWEWWHNAEVYGVDFKSGYNQKTYEYYIDFASENQIPYIIMDEGWAKSTLNPFEPNPTINLPQLINYGKKKNVKIILWFTWLAVEQNFDVFETLEDWGIAGMKIDFMDRSDQWMVNYYERVAKEAAKHHLIVDFHGSFKPAGLEIKYPNVLSNEGVMGMEANIHGGVATPDNNMYLPFVRNAVGPMDYTPGAMYSAHPEDYRPNWTNTMSIGTRAHQIAMYVVFKSGLQMLADNPVNYLREKECLNFITQVPVTWDETKILKAKSPEYIVIAKRKDDTWFIGGMTNSQERAFDFKLDFLDVNKEYAMTIIKDGINADVQAMDYKKSTFPVSNTSDIKIFMVKNGGYVAKIEPQSK